MDSVLLPAHYPSIDPALWTLDVNMNSIDSTPSTLFGAAVSNLENCLEQFEPGADY